MARIRIEWDDDEIEKVAHTICDLMLATPELNQKELFEKAQHCLPADRRRKYLMGWAMADNILKAVKKRFKQVRAGVADAPKDQQRIEELEGQLQARDNEIEELRAQLLVREAPNLTVILQDTPTDIMLAELITRFQRVFQGAMNQPNIMATVLHRMDERLYALEMRGGVGMGMPESTVGAPPPQPDDVYMPRIVIAGIDRANFQRLQHELRHTNVTMVALDTSQPKKVRMISCDKLLICAGHIDQQLTATIQHMAGSRGLLCTGPNGTKVTTNDLKATIIEQTRRIREARKQASNGVATMAAV